MTLWTTTESWKLLTIDGQSVQRIISEFVAPDAIASENGTSSAVLLMDSCPGPNCVPADSSMGNPAQNLIEIQDVFVPIATWLRVIVSLILVFNPIAYVVIIGHMKWKMRNANTNPVSGEMAKANSSDIYLEGLSVISIKGERILDNISINLMKSSLTCLLGKSGSGKSCLLGVLR